MENLYFESFDGTKIYCYLWNNVTNPKGVVQISHGMCEYAMRYDNFAKYLNENGYIVFADDHRGHGVTETDKNRGRHKGDIFKDTVKDLVEIHKYLKNKYNLPQLFIGHSYGSFLGQRFLEEGTDVRGVALAGSAYMPKLTLIAGLALSTIPHLFFGSYRPSYINKMSDLKSKSHYKGEKGRSLWLTRDTELRQKFIDDPMCGVNMSLNFCYYMIKGMYETWKSKNSQKININTPIALFSGTMDPIGEYGKSVPILKKKYDNLGVKNVQIHMYKDYRHEVLNELDSLDVYKDVLDFFDTAII
jgi:alpha-beta hydrolase superfamily lysophospholipase